MTKIPQINTQKLLLAEMNYCSDKLYSDHNARISQWHNAFSRLVFQYRAIMELSMLLLTP